MKITILGLGAMGSRIATNLLKAGYELTVWNRTPSATRQPELTGTTIKQSPGEAVAKADIVISMVRDDEASKRVWLSPEDGALTAMRADAIGIESSTCTISWIKTLSEAFARKRVSFLDAPVAGSRNQAEEAQLIHLIGGEADTINRVQTVLSSIGGARHHIGPAGCGTAMKLLVNAMLGIQVATIAELLSNAEKTGLNPASVVNVLAQTAVCSPATRAAADNMLNKDFSPAFPVNLMEKDLSYLTSGSCEELLPVSKAALNVFKLASSKGFGEDNMTGVAKLYKQVSNQ